MTNSPRWSSLLRRNDLPATLATVARFTSLAAVAATSVVLAVVPE
ncbi:hypothetical protein SAMN04488564_101887 [Lentzea waywayandensis]|uniref:Uncharacterized protein n=1 Tax=Lentzea waywayandensis TaxID=84724 RepID=A0A1I6D271_9PSEU|nr:hypothetical protein [Lentzea waywayandensis]SFQ99575.1 hypothetical protein SAMN04488564_101887 [Lentzea waywayandensis]